MQHIKELSWRAHDDRTTVAMADGQFYVVRACELQIWLADYGMASVACDSNQDAAGKARADWIRSQLEESVGLIFERDPLFNSDQARKREREWFGWLDAGDFERILAEAGKLAGIAKRALDVIAEARQLAPDEYSRASGGVA